MDRVILLAVTVLLVPVIASGQMVEGRTIGAFTFARNADPMVTGEMTFLLTTPTSEHYGLPDANLILACAGEGNPAAMYFFDKHLVGDSGSIDVTYRVLGIGEAVGPTPWMLSGRQAVTSSVGAMVLAYTMLAGEILAIQVEDAEGRTVWDEFSMAGLDDALELLPCF